MFKEDGLVFVTVTLITITFVQGDSVYIMYVLGDIPFLLAEAKELMQGMKQYFPL